MPKPSLLAVNDLDSRREIWSLLHKLPPRRRVAFLGRCCGSIVKDRGYGPKPSLKKMHDRIRDSHRCDRADDALTNEIYTDLLSMAANWGFDLEAGARDLERAVRDYERS